MATKLLRPRMVLIGLFILSVLLLAGDASRAQTSYGKAPKAVSATANISQKVIRPLKARHDFRFAFSRARVVAPNYDVRLLASAPTKDRFGAGFVPFHVMETPARPMPKLAKAGERSPVVTGCVYPATGDVYVLDVQRSVHVPAQKHPALIVPEDRRAPNPAALPAAKAPGPVDPAWKGRCEPGSVS